MPKAPEPNPHSASSRTNCLCTKSDNTAKPAAQQQPPRSPLYRNVPRREAIAAAKTYHVDPDEEPNYLIRIEFKRPGFPRPVLEVQQDTFDSDEEEVGTWPKPQNEEEWTLREVYERNEWDKEDGTKTTGQIYLRYEYNIGDGWDHTIILLGRAEKGLHQVLAGREDNVPSILCSGGQGHPCAEDCGAQFG
ncbi:MAG: hypothetical protein LQ349_009086 [Xanthoria aureola]|nr:MAG: hypothetical protein LQ349_009086 [Xanthoria aureola]